MQSAMDVCFSFSKHNCNTSLSDFYALEMEFIQTVDLFDHTQIITYAYMGNVIGEMACAAFYREDGEYAIQVYKLIHSI